MNSTSRFHALSSQYCVHFSKMVCYYDIILLTRHENDVILLQMGVARLMTFCRVSKKFLVHVSEHVHCILEAGSYFARAVLQSRRLCNPVRDGEHLCLSTALPL